MIAYLGGIRSGKSRLAEERFGRDVARRGLPAAYLATLDSSLLRGDPEMRRRLEEHRGRRPAHWATVEIGRDLAGNAGHKAMLLDGLGMWVSLRMDDRPEMVLAEAQAFVASASHALTVLVLDEAGLGGVSANAATRRFADLNGRVNQLVCAGAHEVWRVDAGIASRIK
jgi:adenosylcobinamide kinase/adenosylcobinamide-phosphate guanylyltransferase